MPSHTNKQIKKHIESSSALTTKMDALTAQLLKTLVANFKSNLGVSLPNAIEANVRVLQYDMVYSTDPLFDEYKNGADTLLQGILEENWPKVVLSAMDVVTNVINTIIGSGTVQTGAHIDSAKYTEKDAENPLKEKTFVMACLAIVEEASAKDWATAENFYVSYYALVVWTPKEADQALITTTR